MYVMASVQILLIPMVEPLARISFPFCFSSWRCVRCCACVVVGMRVMSSITCAASSGATPLTDKLCIPWILR